MILEFLLVFLDVFFQILRGTLWLGIISSWGIMLGINFFRWVAAVISPITTPLRRPFRGAVLSGVDFSAFIAIIALSFVSNLLSELIIKMF